MSRLFLMFMLINTTLSAKHLAYNLQKAINLHLVKATAKSLGGYQGYCINMQIENLTKDSLLILVEAGRRLIAGNKDEQDILLVKDIPIAMRKHEQKSVPLKGYCCQSTKHAPSTNGIYAINHLADSDLVQVARHLNKNCFNSGIEQDAVWAISNKQPIANIPNNEDTTTIALRQLLANLKGEKLPWYTILKNTYVTHYGQIMAVNQKLLGQLNYNNDQKAYATLMVYNDKGIEVCTINSAWLGIGNNIPYQIDLPVKGLDKGKYSLVLKTREREVLKEAFEI